MPTLLQSLFDVLSLWDPFINWVQWKVERGYLVTGAEKAYREEGGYTFRIEERGEGGKVPKKFFL